MRNMTFYIVVVLLLMASGLFGQAASPRYKVQATGQAPAELPRAREAAVEDALRQAVEAGAGVKIASETKVQNFQLIKDVIYMQTAGLVETYKVLRENPNQQGLYTVRVEAIVSRAQVDMRLQAWKSLIQRKGWPRLMVVGALDSNPFDRILTAKIQGLMERRSLTVIDQSVLNENQLRAAQRAAFGDADMQKAAVISQEVGADYLVIAEINGEELPVEDNFGVKLYPADATGMFKVITADTAMVIASEVISRQVKAQSSRQAIREVTDRIVEQTFEEAIKRVAFHWLEDVDSRGGQQIQLVLHKFPFERINNLIEGLNQSGAIKDSIDDSTDAKGRSQIRLITNESAVNIAGVLLKVDPGISIAKTSKNTIEIEAATEEWKPLSKPIPKLHDSPIPPPHDITSERIEESSEVEEIESLDGPGVQEQSKSSSNDTGPRLKVPKKSIAVMTFKILGKLPSGSENAGELLSEAMVSEIDSERFEIYERSQLNMLLKEKGFQESVLVDDPGNAAAFGKMAGVQYVVLGSLGKLGTQYHLSSRLVDCQSGKVKDRGSVTFQFIDDWVDKIPELVNLLGLRAGGHGSARRFPTGNDLVDSVNVPAGFAVKIRTTENKQTYVEGERISFIVRASRDCFITLITVDSKGEMTLLLPNAWQRRAFVRRDQEIRVPSLEANFSFPIKPPHGETLVKAIATLKPLVLTGVTTKGIEDAGFLSLSRGVKAIGLEGDADAIEMTDLRGLHDLLEPTEWATAELVVITEVKY